MTLVVSPVVFHSVMSLLVSFLVAVLDLQQERVVLVWCQAAEVHTSSVVLGHIICVLCISNRNDILFIRYYF